MDIDIKQKVWWVQPLKNKYFIASNYTPYIYFFLTKPLNKTDVYFRKKHVLCIICDASDKF